MKSLTKFGLLLACSLLASLPFANAANDKAQPPGHDKAIPITATIIGNFDYLAEGGPAWVGYAIVKFDDNPAQVAAFVDRGSGPPQVRDDGSIYGTETITLRFADGSGSFDIACRFEGIPESTPSLYILHETGTIANGTGNYAKLSGSVTVRGPFLSPDPGVNPTVFDVPPSWIGMLHGRVKGMSNP